MLFINYLIIRGLFITLSRRLSLVVDIAAANVGFLTVMLLNGQGRELFPTMQQVVHKFMI